MKNIFMFLISFLIVSFINISNAQERFEQRPIEEALNPDGTLKQGVQGSFKVEGYQMHTGANGKPIFVPKTQNITSGTWEPLGTGAQNGVNGQVRALALDGQGNVYVGGAFTTAGGVNANNVARYNVATNSWSSLGTGSSNGVNNQVNALALDGQGNVFVGGTFTTAGGVSANYVARYSVTTNSWSSLGAGSNNGVSATVIALAVDGQSNVFVGGTFTSASGVSANYVARYNVATNSWSSLGTGNSNGVSGGIIDTRVNALALDGQGNVYVGGNFTTAGGVSANRVARYNVATNNWSSLGTGSSNGVGGFGLVVVFALALDGQGNLYVGGGFNTAGGVSVNNVARYSSVTNTWNSLGTGSSNGVSANVNALAVDGQNIVYIGGAFPLAGGVFANYVAAYNLGTNSWSTLGTGSSSGVNSGVNALVVDGQGNVYVGGIFTTAGGVSANYVARWNSGATNVEQIGDGVPSNYSLSQNYPNPFNPSTTISFSIPNSEFVTLKVYDVLGREVATLVNENLNAGSYSYNFDASNLTSGVYLYKLQTGKYSETKKMILSK